MAVEGTLNIVLIFLFITDSVGINITIHGSSKFIVPGQPFIFTCTFASNVISPKHLKKNGKILESVQLGLNNICYNVTINGASPCDQSACSCSQEEDIFTATWTLESINEPVSIWECEEGISRSPTLILRRAVLVSSVRVIGFYGSQIDVVAGQNLSLTCVTGQSRPRSYIMWYIGNDKYTMYSTYTVTNGYDELTSVTSVLTFTPARDQAYLAVNCKAYNIDPNTTVELVNKPKLNVQYLPPRPTAEIIHTGDSLSVKEKTNVTLQCEVIGGNPLSVINWKCFSGTVTNVSESGRARSSITFTAISSLNGKICICSATHPVSAIQNDFVQINVMYNPKLISLQPTNTYYIFNETDHLGPVICSADCNPKCSYKWTGSGFTTITTAILNINGINKEQGGSYYCTASNSLGNLTSENIVIEVNYGPGDSLIFDPPSLNYTVNETYQLGPIECRATCKPPCAYKWMIPGQNNILRNNLTILNIQRSDAGLYKCIAYNGITNESSKGINVIVHYAAKIKSLNISKNNFTISEHSTPTISCHAEGLPLPQITLRHLGNNTILSQSTGVFLQYNFTSARCDDTGEYICEAVNTFKPKPAIVKDIFVLCYPRSINITNKDRYVAYGSGETLSIAIMYLAYPKPTFQWYFKSSMMLNQSKLTNDSKNVEIINIFEYQSEVFRHVSHIIRYSLQEDNFGSYLTYAGNDVNVTTNIFSVVAKGQPNQPSNVEAKCWDHQSANITWVSEFNNGDPQTFAVQYKISNKTFVSPEIKDPGLKERFTLGINKLKESSTYNFTVVAKNEFGETKSLSVNCTTEKSKSDSKNVLGLEIGLCIGSLAVMFVLVTSVIFIIRRMKNTSSEGAYENAGAVKEHKRDYYNLEVRNDTNIYNVLESEDGYENAEKIERNKIFYESLQTPNDEQTYGHIRCKVQNDKSTITTADINVYVNTAIR